MFVYSFMFFLQLAFRHRARFVVVASFPVLSVSSPDSDVARPGSASLPPSDATSDLTDEAGVESCPSQCGSSWTLSASRLAI